MLTVFNWRILFRCRNCHAIAANSMAIQTKCNHERDWYKGLLFEAWKSRAGQTRGMQRMARKIKALKAELASEGVFRLQLNNALMTAKDDIAELRDREMFLMDQINAARRSPSPPPASQS
jgi:hypothetical protein